MPTQRSVGEGFIPSLDAASEVLHNLIDARLLTSYEVREDEHDPIRRVEIIHESLLANWPRLVRWQTQDQEGAQLREELRQSARTWDEHGRHHDRLWTGTAYREYRLWRDRYPGGLTDVEEAFGSAMTSLAGRRRRQRRIAAAVGVSLLVAVLALVTGLWRRSVVNEQRAEAQKLLALGQLRLDDHPTVTLAHAIGSLELVDSEEARLLALNTLWEGPPVSIVNENPTTAIAFSPGGSWLIQAHGHQDRLTVVSRDGGQRVVENTGAIGKIQFGSSDDIFLTITQRDSTIGLWSARAARQLASARLSEETTSSDWANTAMTGDGENSKALVAFPSGQDVIVKALLPDGRLERVGTIGMTASPGETAGTCLPLITGNWVGVVDGGEVSVVEIDEDGFGVRRHLGRQGGKPFPWCDPDPLGRYFITLNDEFQVTLWDVAGQHPPAVSNELSGFYSSYISHDGSYFFAVDWTFGEATSDVLVWKTDGFRLDLQRRIRDAGPAGSILFDPNGPRLAMDGPAPMMRLWSLAAPSSSRPVMLRQGSGWGWEGSRGSGFSPDGSWLARSYWGGTTLAPLGSPLPIVFRPEVNAIVGGAEFEPSGRFLAVAVDRTVSVFPLEGSVPAPERTVVEIDKTLSVWDLNVSPDGSRFAVIKDSIWIVEDGGDQWELPGPWSRNAAFSPDGRVVATPAKDEASITIWDLETRQQVALLPGPGAKLGFGVMFIDDGRLIVPTAIGVLALDIEKGEYETLVTGSIQSAIASSDGRRLMVLERGDSGVQWDPVGSPLVYELETGVATRLESHGTNIYDGAFSPDGTAVATSDRKGVIRVGPATGEEPHLLTGHESIATPLDIDPLGRWIVSGSHDNTIRLWPMPDLSKPPLHTLPREELIAKLKTLTNLRVVRDPGSATGWKLTHDPFPGWETVPTW